MRRKVLTRARRCAIGNQKYAFARISQRQRLANLLLRNGDQRRRCRTRGALDETVEAARTLTAPHQKSKTVRRVDHRHSAQGARRARQHAGFGAVSVNDIGANPSDEAHQRQPRPRIGNGRNRTPHGHLKHLHTARAIGRNIACAECGIASARHRQHRAERLRVQRRHQFAQVAPHPPFG